jgi:hypothetical protein
VSIALERCGAAASLTSVFFELSHFLSCSARDMYSSMRPLIAFFNMRRGRELVRREKVTETGLVVRQRLGEALGSIELRRLVSESRGLVQLRSLLLS